MPQVTEPVSPKAKSNRVTLFPRPDSLDALDSPRGCRLFQSKVQQGCSLPEAEKGRRAMTPLRPDLGAVEPGAQRLRIPSSSERGEGPHRPCPLGRAQSARSPSILYSGEGHTGWWAPRQRTPRQGSRWLPQRGSGTCSQTCLGSLMQAVSPCVPCNSCTIAGQGKRVWSRVSEGRTRHVPAA